jgi:hypothetical protein
MFLILQPLVLSSIYYINIHSEKLSAVLPHTENVKQLFCKIVRSVMMGQWGSKQAGAGVL